MKSHRLLAIAVAVLVLPGMAYADAGDNAGTDFIMGFLPNHSGSNAVELHLTSDFDTNVTVDYPVNSPTFTTTVAVGPGNVTTVSLPTTAAAWPSGSVQNRAVRAYADREFVCYMINRQTSTSDAALAIPVDTLGTEYIAITWPNSDAELVVVAAHDNTTVTIDKPGGTPFDVPLNYGEGYMYSGAGDLSGTIITADQPVGMSNGNRCANFGYGACDHVFEVAPPVSTWGLTIPVANIPETSLGVIYKITAAQDDTAVMQDGAAIGPINRGQIITTNRLAGNHIYSGDKPIFVMQCMLNRGGSGGNPVGDPALGNMIPAGEYLSSYTFSTVGGGQFAENYLTIIATSADVGTLTLDGLPIAAGDFTQIPDSDYWVALELLAEGVHTSVSNGVHGITVEGFNSYDSYLYPGGFGLEFDCNENGVLDGIDIAEGTSEDTNTNGIPDECEDCNNNGVLDDEDIAQGTSEDCSGNGIPDECEADCNNNTIADSCDIDVETSPDCNVNGVPDECDIADGTSDDCNFSGVPDECEWQDILSEGGGSRSDPYIKLCQYPDQREHGSAFMVPIGGELEGVAAESFAFEARTTITDFEWWGTYRDVCGADCDPGDNDNFVVTFYVSEFGLADTVVAAYELGEADQQVDTGRLIAMEGGFTEWKYSSMLSPPFVADAGRKYWVEVTNELDPPCVWWWEVAPLTGRANGTSLYDPVGAGYDPSDLAPHDLAMCVIGMSAAQDCNENGVFDSLEINGGTSEDCQPNFIPDECEDDRNLNGIPDDCDIVGGTSRDDNFNGVPDEADCLTMPGDMDGDCDRDLDDLALLTACLGRSGVNLLGGCVCADFNIDGAADMSDFLAFSLMAGVPDDTCVVTPADACPDSWATGGGARADQTFYNFGWPGDGGNGPIPADFFGPGSDPFKDIVTMIGRPADPNGLHGEIDTQIQHGKVEFDPITGEAITDIQIITLELIGIDPITVTYNGGNDPEEWLVAAGLSPHHPEQQGQLNALLDQLDGNAGTFDATVYVQPAFIFVKRQDLIDNVLPECVNVRILDTAGDGSRAAMPPIEMSFTGQPFVRTVDPSLMGSMNIPGCAQGNFVPGVLETTRGGRATQELTCTSHITEGEEHYFCPPECQGDDVCRYRKTGKVTPLLGCVNPPAFPAATLGATCPGGVGDCPPNTIKFKGCPGGGFAFQVYGNPACIQQEDTCDGACCSEDGSCVLSTAALCTGDYQGDGTTCDPNPCTPPTGACCHGDATCTQEAQDDCTGANDTYQGDDTNCGDYSPSITTQPTAQSACEGENATFTIAATASSGTLQYQWKKDGADVGGDSSTLTLNNVQGADDASSISCEVSDDCGTTTSNAATLSVFGDAACPACAGAVASTLAVVEVALATACGPSECGLTVAPSAGTQVLVILTCLDDGPCHIEFRVTAARDMESGPCPGSVTVITGGGDADVTAANFCGMVDGFWNGGSGDGGGDCFLLGGTAYGQPTCTDLHERAHVTEYVPLLNAELALLLARPSMAPIPMDGNPPSQSCAQAEAARTAAITADVNTAYADATTAWVAQGEGVNGWTAEFPCATNIAISICQWAMNAATVDVDTCATCANNALGTVYTDVCGDGAVNQPSEQCDDGNTTNGDGCSATCQTE